MLSNRLLVDSRLLVNFFEKSKVIHVTFFALQRVMPLTSMLFKGNYILLSEEANLDGYIQYDFFYMTFLKGKTIETVKR